MHFTGSPNSQILHTRTDSLSLIKDEGIIDQFASSLNGAAIVLEHRYFGESLPYDDLSEKNLERLTIQQSIDDLAYFAQNVKLPMNLSTLPNNTMDNRRSRLRSSCPDEVLMKSCVRRNGHDYNS